MTPYPDAKILVVDDEAHNVVLVERALEREGYAHISGVLDSRQAVERFVHVKPDLVLLDLRMPHLDGYEVYAALKALNARLPAPVPVLILTAAREEFTKCWELGMRDFISKPIEQLPELWARVETLLTIRMLQLEQAARPHDAR